MRERLSALWEAGRQHETVDVAYQAVRRDMRSGGELLASALAMRLFILLLPFVAAVLAGLGLVTNSDPATARSALEGIGVAATAAQSVTASARISSGSLWLVLGGSLFALVLASRTTLRALWTVHTLAWSLPPSRAPRPWLGAWVVIGLLLALMGLMLLSPVLREAGGLAFGLVGMLMMLALTTGFWLLIAMLLPRGPAPWTALLPGAVVTAVGMTCLHAITTFWATSVISHYNTAYGSLGTSVALLLWFYVLGRLIVAGAMLNAARWERRPIA